jgi:hypothetical protein
MRSLSPQDTDYVLSDRSQPPISSSGNFEVIETHCFAGAKVKHGGDGVQGTAR